MSTSLLAWVYTELYRKGEKIPKDTSKAVFWYNIAYENGNEAAGILVGLLYLEGKEIARNTAKAAQLFKAAAKSKEESIRGTALKCLKQFKL